MKDAKYLIAYIAPISAVAGLYLGGWWSFGMTYIAFGLIPFFEFFIPKSVDNHAPEVEEDRSRHPFFDWLLYSHVPIMFGLIAWACTKFQNGGLSTLEMVGTTFNIGIMIGSFGINVGHELGHRTSKFEQFLSKVLLLPALYQHFFIEHNRGHHKNVATELDPATSRRGENIYFFWWRSVTDSYMDAWALESDRLKRAGKAFWSFDNEMLRFQFIQLAYLGTIWTVFGTLSLVFAIVAAVIGFLLLETVNYIEHYGLQRKMQDNGRYEPVLPHHSWNSDHELGRIFLYELTRHSDHHYKATRKYQVLRHFDESPQLPFGYPMCMLIALVPPVWFGLMEKQLAQEVDRKLEFA
jgi:alkane 1-monooxygenase